MSVSHRTPYAAVQIARNSSLVALVGVLAAALGVLAAPGPADSSPPAEVERYIVVLKDGVAHPAVVADEHAGKYGAAVGFVYRHALKGYSATLPTDRVAALRADPRVAFVSDDRTVQAVGTVPLAPRETAPTGVRRLEAATSTTAHGASSANVAVIDTGIDLTHPDLNAAHGKRCVSPTRKSAQDDNGHGTHVAGTIGARNTGSGVVGVAPGTKLYAVKVLSSSGSGTWSQIICGLDWVTANSVLLNIKVVNMSLGGSGSNDGNCGNSNNDALHKAICRSTAAGVTYVVAAGNDASDFAGFVPAAYPEVLTVTAMSDSDGAPGGTGGAPTCRTGEQDDQYATFSNFATAASEINHSVGGPGVCTLSTWLNGGYNTISGTSMASPHVAGAVALCMGNGGTPGVCAGKTPSQIIQQIRSDASSHATSSNGYVGDPLRPVTGKHFGYLAWAGGY